MPFPSENQPQQLPSFSSFALGNLKLFFFFRFIFAVKHVSCESSKKSVNLLVTSPLPHEEFLSRRAVRVIIQCTVSPRGRASYHSRRKPKKYFILRNYNFCIHWDWLRTQHLPGSLQNNIPQGYRHQRSFKQASQSLSAAGDTALNNHLIIWGLYSTLMKRHPLDLMAGRKVIFILGVTQEIKVVHSTQRD